MSIQRIYIVVENSTEFSYWTTLKLAQGALTRYRKHKLVTDAAEIQVIGVNIDGFTRRKPTKEK